uniref:Uncharacterized protein n=1 Tax=Arundo donax TaxID=35708 RepID=A0A0A9EDD3_ARUDO
MASLAQLQFRSAGTGTRPAMAKLSGVQWQREKSRVQFPLLAVVIKTKEDCVAN